ncbi:MAG TPA: DUF4231 domain-containing protein [Ardenticatenaceae bacterium]|nr:DUF4231 domain-containing protein [Ardenticatenaceae bacterium]
MSKEEIYLQQRWQSQRDYYSAKSAFYKRWHHGLQLFIALGAIAVPVILNIAQVPQLVPTILSALVAGAAALENVYRFGDNWRNFRQTLEGLKREKVMYDAGAGPYRETDNAFALFVERVESLISEETKVYFPEERDGARS